MTWVLFVSVALANGPRPHGSLAVLETEGALTRADVEPIVAQLGSPTAYCAGVAVGPVESPVHFALTVKNGRILSIDDVKLGDLKALDELQTCLVRKLGSWPFPGARGTTRIAVDFAISTAPSGPDTELGTRPIASLAKQLGDEGRLYQPDVYVTAALTGADPCAGAPEEFALRRCTDTKGALLDTARKALDQGFVLVPVRGEMGTFDFEAETFPVRIEPLLVPGGIGTATAPGLTLGKLEARYASPSSSEYELTGGAPVLTHTTPMNVDAAEGLLARTDRELYGIAIVKLRNAYDTEIRTGAWESKAHAPATWSQDVRAGRARDEDTTITWYAVDVDMVALELYDPETGEAVTGWLADGYGLKNEQGALELVEPERPEG